MDEAVAYLQDLIKAGVYRGKGHRITDPKTGKFRYIYTQEVRKRQKREVELSDILKLKNEAKKTNMNFGKHKGKTVYQVLKEDPKYLLWAGNNTDYPEAELGRKIYVGSANMNTKVEFGKHEGKSIREIVKEDFDYLDWLSSEGFSDNHVAVAVYEKMKTYVEKNPDKIGKSHSLYSLAQSIKERKEAYSRYGY